MDDVRNTKVIQVRIWVLCAALAVAAMVTQAALSTRTKGDLGLFEGRAPHAAGIPVQGVYPNGAAFRAGIRAGDRILVDRMTPYEMIAFRFPIVGRPSSLVVEHNGSPTRRSIVPVRSSGGPEDVRWVLSAGLSLLYAAMGWLVSWKGTDVRRASPIVLFLTGWALNYVFTLAAAVMPNSALAYTEYGWLWSATSALWLTGLLRFVARFPERVSFVRRWLWRSIPWIVVAHLGIYAWRQFAVPFPRISLLLAGQDADTLVGYVAWILTSVLIVVAVLDGWGVASKEERAAVASSGSTLVLFATVEISRDVMTLSGLSWLNPYAGALESLSGVGMTYAVLRHRLVDFEPLISRAAVFGAVSLTLLVLFAFAEWLIAKLAEGVFEDTRHALVLELVVAVAAGVMLQPTHRVFDRRLNRFVFQARYRAVDDLKRVGSEMDIVTKSQAALDLLYESLCRDTGANLIGIYLADASGRYQASRSLPMLAPLDRDDEIVLRMRRWQEPFTVERPGHVLHGSFVTPMIVRGALRGFVACGRRLNRAPYSKIERDAITEVANRFAIAYEWLTPNEERLRAEYQPTH